MKNCDFIPFRLLLEYDDCGFGYPCFDVYLDEELIGRVSKYGKNTWSAWGADGPYGPLCGVGCTKEEAVATMLYLQICGPEGLGRRYDRCGSRW